MTKIKSISDPRCAETTKLHDMLTADGWSKKKTYLEGDLVFAYYEKDGYGINFSLGYDEDIKNEFGY